MNSRLCCLLFCFLNCLTTNAQSSKKDLELSIEALNKAMISQDKSALENLTAEELSYGHSTGTIENKSEFVKNVLTGPTKFSSIDFTDQRIEITDNIAIVRDIAAYKGSNNSTPLDVKIGLLMIWRKQGANWKLLARQGYKLP
jgi:hypothetical protein